MRRLASTVALLLLTVGGLAAAEETGRLQVTCRPGVRVYLDGDFVGLTAVDEDGLYLRDVPAGGHVVRVEKLGFEPQEVDVEVRAGRATEFRVGELAPVGSEPAPTAAPTPSSATPEPPAPSRASLAADTAATVTVVPLPPPSAAGAPPPAAPPVAPAVAPAPAERAARTTLVATPPPTPTPVSAVPTVVLSRSSKPASDITFAYRASGAAKADGRSVAIWRERGGPKAPVLVLTCSDDDGCEQQTSPRFPPGAYRFRVVFSRTQGEGSKAAVLFRHEVSLELDTHSDAAYLVEAVYGGDDPAHCSATVREVRLVQGGTEPPR